VNTYTKEDYNGGALNWDSQSLKNGHIFIANNSGTLEFDGKNWTLHKLPNNTINRSICISDIGRIYAGGQDEIGYFAPNRKGTLEFTSIREHIPLDYLPLEDVWQIKSKESKIYFLSVNKVYIYDEVNDIIKVIDPKSPITSLINFKDEVYYYDLFKGVVTMSNRVMPRSDQLKYTPVLNILEINGQKAYVTEKNGVFIDEGTKILPFESDLHDYLIRNNVFSSIQNEDGSAIIGTKFGGVVIINSDGEILQTLNKEQGLSSNNAQTILQTNENIWIGTSNGINYVQLSSPLRIVHPDGETRGTFYDIALSENQLYFGSNNGLYSTKLNKDNNIDQSEIYKFLPGSQGQVWGLSKVGDDLLMGHNKGAFQIENGKANIISQVPGAWTFLEANNQNEMYVGTYEGVDIYKKQNGTWSFYKKLEGFIESSRIIISVKPMELWVSHPYRGVYKIIHDENYFVKKVEIYDEKQGLPSTLLNYIFDIDGVPYVTAKTGIYYYDRKSDKFLKDPELNKMIDESKNVRRLYSLSVGKIWYIAEHEVGVLERNSKGKYEKKIFENLKDVFVDGFEKLFFLSNDIALVCTDNNVLTVDTEYESINTPPNIYINKVKLTGTKDSLLFDGYAIVDNKITYHQSKEQIPELRPNENGFIINYCSPSEIQNVSYSYSLSKGTDEATWSNWTQNTSKEYNNLSHGTYIFSVRAKSSREVVSNPSNFTFKITPPWYLSNWAITLYTILAFSGLAALIFIPRKKYAQEKMILTSAIEESDANLEQVKSEKLEAEIHFKNSELASSTMHLVQKNETITKVRQEIQNVTKNIKDPQAKKEIKKILSILSDDERLEEDWENFSRHFDNVHTDFLKRLSNSYPQLTPKDKKLCAYLRMNLTTKEIAPLLNISVRGVEISRYRLRKKIELEGSKNLNEFMMDF